MPTPIIVHFIGVVPIPVGHEVEVRVYLLDTAIFGKKLEPQIHDPLVVDLDTGIVYGEEWHFEEVIGTRENVVRPDMPLVPRANLQEHSRWRGRVAATRIAVIGGGTSGIEGYTQTSLSIIPNDGQGPYR